jgi:hypothetical protein
MTFQEGAMRRRAYLLLWILSVSLLLGLTYLWLSPSSRGSSAVSAQSHTYSLTISSDRPAGEPPVFKASQSDIITLTIRSDRPGEVHVHGYDREIAVERGSETILTFPADTVGMYPLHFHEPLNAADPHSPVLHSLLAVLEVGAR